MKELEQLLERETHERERLEDSLTDTMAQYSELKHELESIEKMHKRMLQAKQEEFETEKSKLQGRLNEASEESANYRKQLQNFESEMEETLSRVLDIDKKNRNSWKK